MKFSLRAALVKLNLPVATVSFPSARGYSREGVAKKPEVVVVVVPLALLFLETIGTDVFPDQCTIVLAAYFESLFVSAFITIHNERDPLSPYLRLYLAPGDVVRGTRH